MRPIEDDNDAWVAIGKAQSIIKAVCEAQIDGGEYVDALFAVDDYLMATSQWLSRPGHLTAASSAPGAIKVPVADVDPEGDRPRRSISRQRKVITAKRADRPRRRAAGAK